MPVSNTPWLGTVTLTTANQVYQLSNLLAALPAAQRPILTYPVAQFVTVQANPDNATGARYYVGNSFLSSTMYGVMLFASQSWPIYSVDANLIRLDQIYLMCNTANETVNIAFLTR